MRVFECLPTCLGMCGCVGVYVKGVGCGCVSVSIHESMCVSVMNVCVECVYVRVCLRVHKCVCVSALNVC